MGDTRLDYYSVCNKCRKNLYELTNREFEQYASSRLIPVQCQMCGNLTDNWFTRHGVLVLKKAVEEVRSK